MYPSPHIAKKENKPFVSTSDFRAKAGKVLFRGIDAVLSYAVYSVERENNGKTKGLGSFL